MLCTHSLTTGTGPQEQLSHRQPGACMAVHESQGHPA